MLAYCAQSVIKRDVGGAAIGFGEAAALQLDQRGGFFRPGRENAARPVVFEAARNQPHAIRQERRGERVAGMALISLAVKGKTQHPAAVDLAAGGKPEGLGHGPPPW